MKNIIIVILGIMLALLVVNKTYSSNSEIISELNGESLFGDTVKVAKIHDGNTKCYIATARQQTSTFVLSGTMISISCVRIK